MLLLDVSRFGCLIESDVEFRNGTTGAMHIDLWGVPCRYPVRVSRVRAHRGCGHAFRVGAEFLWRKQVPTASVAGRHVARGRPGKPARVLKLDRPWFAT